MCGIAGLLSFGRPFHPSVIRPVNDCLKHRGPDDEGFLTVNFSSRAVRQWTGPDSKTAGTPIQNADEPANLALAHRRLSIIDLSTHGHQPMSNGDGSLWIIFNGEIYNHVEPESGVKRRNFETIILQIPTEFDYNMRQKATLTQTSLKVNFPSDEQRTAKSQTFLRGSESYALRWNAPFSAVLSKIEFEEIVAKTHLVATPKQSLSSNGSYHDYDLHHGGWDEKNFGYSYPSLQWLLSRSAGVEQLSGHLDSEEIPEGVEYARDRRVEAYSRYAASKDVQLAQGSQQHGLGFGLHGFASVWLADRRGQSRLQSQEAGPTQLSSVVVFSWIYAGLLAWYLAFWRHSRFQRSFGVLGTMSAEDSKVFVPNSPAGGLRLLRPQVHRTYRRAGNRLRHRGRYDPAHQRTHTNSALPHLSQGGRLAGGPSYLSTQQVEQAPSVHRDSQTQTRGRESTDATHPLAIQRLLLPYSGEQSALERSSDMALLHEAMPGRTGYPRTQREFSFGQDSYQQLLGQPSVLPFDSSGLRFGQLVQAPVPAPTLVFGYFADDSYGLVLLGRSFGEFWRQKSTQSSKSVSQPKTLYADSSEDQPIQDSLVFVDLSKNDFGLSTSEAQNQGDSRLFQVELRSQLVGLGYKFRSSSDTEVILAAYEIWSKECLERFNGMWAFVIYDSRQNVLFGSRDRFGVKPFYYYFDKLNFAFASEIKALLRFPFVEKKLNLEAVFDYLVLGRIESEPEGFFKNVLELLPGHNFELNLNTMSFRLWRYYELHFYSKWQDFREDKLTDYVSQTENLVRAAVQLRLRSDVPIGSCLSGGIDSSAIVCLVNQLLKQSPIPSVGRLQNVFTASYENKDIDESRWAELVVKRTQTTWHKVFPNEQDLIKDLEDVVYAQDIPFGSTSIYSQYRVMKLAKEKGVKVLLDGQGGDELFAGYGFFYPAFFGEMIKHLKFGRVISEFNKLSQSPLKSNYLLAALTGVILSKICPRSLLQRLWQNHKGANYISSVFLNKFQRRMETLRDLGAFELNQMLQRSMTNYNLKSLLHHEDRNSMRFSIEARTPFADDINLIEHVFQIPSAYKIHDGWSKYLLRKSMQGVLPQELCDRKDKIGFATPEYHWLSQAKNKLKEYIAENAESLKGFVQVEKILQNWDQILELQPRSRITNIWRVINLAVWRRIFKV